MNMRRTSNVFASRIPSLFARNFWRFSARGTGLVAQLLALGLVAQMLGPEPFGLYVLVFSTSSIAGQLIDFGFTRYLFRLAHRGMPMKTMVRWNLVFRCVVAATLVVPITAIALAIELPTLAFLLGLTSNIIYQITFLNRYALLLRDRVAVSLFIESLPPIIFFALLGTSFPANIRLDLKTIMICYLVATMTAFFISIAFAGTLTAWLEGMRSVFRHPPRRILRGAHILAVRSSGIGLEMVLSVTLLNAPIIIASHLGIEDGGELATFQRVLGLAVVLIAVSVTSNLKQYYSLAGVNIFVLSPALLSGLVAGTLTWLGLRTLSLISALYPPLLHATILELMVRLSDHVIVAAAALTLLSIYLHISQAALGGDRHLARCLSTGCGLLTLVLAAFALNRLSMPAFETVFGAFALAELIAIICLLSLIAKGGGRLQIVGNSVSLSHEGQMRHPGPRNGK